MEKEKEKEISKCPECLEPTPADELATFGGMCEECRVYEDFSDDPDDE